MTEPSPSELLAGVAEALEATVLPDLERGPARNQVIAAIGIVRRCGGAIDHYGPYLYADCVDLIETLRRLGTVDSALLDESEQLVGNGYPKPSELATVHRRLSDALAEQLLRAQQAESDQLAALRQLLERMTEREQGVGLSPW